MLQVKHAELQLEQSSTPVSEYLSIQTQYVEEVDKALKFEASHVKQLKEVQVRHEY